MESRQSLEDTGAVFQRNWVCAMISLTSLASFSLFLILKQQGIQSENLGLCNTEPFENGKRLLIFADFEPLLQQRLERIGSFVIGSKELRQRRREKIGRLGIPVDTAPTGDPIVGNFPCGMETMGKVSPSQTRDQSGDPRPRP
ncbi:hypothetical protein PIB30_080407 [Stylosanthes scabra]|uniref:Uncharacterized protein n=1 Tax=Stylosanthes scabra TaxID=79078 RepID=A0ABU6SSN6_9FABA|nr:hypothetical protein [Stylosanthes scabra]